MPGKKSAATAILRTRKTEKISPPSEMSDPTCRREVAVGNRVKYKKGGPGKRIQASTCKNAGCAFLSGRRHISRGEALNLRRRKATDSCRSGYISHDRLPSG
ncbi:hypothetical protein MRX96_000694 [Rhipicephalus microplus]